MKNDVRSNMIRLYKKPGGCQLAAYTAKDYFFESPFEVLSRSKINKTCVSNTLRLFKKPLAFHLAAPAAK